MSNFVHLNVHSEYSRMEGVSSLESLCQAARERGFDTIALTDTNGIYGAVRFQEIAKQNDLKPIIGAELKDKNKRALLLVKNKAGYANLCRILSAQHEDAAFDMTETIARSREGLIVISDSPEILKSCKRDSAEDLCVEMTPGINMQDSYVLSRSEKLRPVATNRVHFANAQEFFLYPVLQAIHLNTKLSRLGDLPVRPQHWLTPPNIFARDFPHCPEALHNTRRVADACDFLLDFRTTIFPAFHDLNGRDAFANLREKTYAGAIRRYGSLTPDVLGRIEHELQIIAEKHYAHYFLLVDEITKKNPITSGRGSAASSIVSYCLEITHVDPVKHDLFFERFLSRERGDPPDIDIDFPWDERDAVLSSVFSDYGRERVAMVANHNHLGLAGALREIAKIYGLPAGEISRISARLLKQKEIAWLSENPSARAWTESLCHTLDLGEPWPEILELAMKVAGHFRNLSVHCGGLVIVPDEIRKYAPVEKAACGLPVLQWEKEQVEEAGLIKIDLLGNRSLSVIRDTLAAINRNYGEILEYRNWDPLGDESTKELIKKGESIGCFNIESPAIRLLLKKLWLKMPEERKTAVDVFDYLIMVSSLIRPAAISFVPEFIQRAHSGNSQPPHPALGKILEQTHGIMLYQEDVTRAAIALAGFSQEQADQLRKALNKKRKAKKLKEYGEDFYRGGRARGVPLSAIEAVWKMILSFAGYSFCKAHSASYAQVSFKCAYLKARYPAEFMAAVLSNEGGYYPTLAYISEARRMGLEIQAPDINDSQWSYKASDQQIRVGFQQIRGIKKSFIDRLIGERQKHRCFSSFRDFCSRINPELAQSRLLIKAGCFDSIASGLSRPGMLWQAYAHDGQGDTGAVPNPEEYPPDQKIAHEIECFGFPLSCHPLELYRINLPENAFIQACQMQDYVGKRIRLLGWLISEKLTQTKKGDPMEFVTFEDTSATYEAIFFPDVYRRLWNRLTPNRPFIIDGIVEEHFGAVTVNVKEINYLDAVQNRCYRNSVGSKDDQKKTIGRGFSPAGPEFRKSARCG